MKSRKVKNIMISISCIFGAAMIAIMVHVLMPSPGASLNLDITVFTLGINWMIFNSFIGMIFSGLIFQALLRSGMDVAAIFIASIFTSSLYKKEDLATV